jgi:predicted dehydrogenase
LRNADVRVAVIGAGHLGQYHAKKYAEAPGVRLVGIADVSAERAKTVAERHATASFTDFRALLGQVDAVSIAVPAAAHHAIASECLKAGLHILLEKPITVTLDEADDLIALANAKQRVLQIGHVERFNPVGAELLRQVDHPLFIECHRLAPFKPRGTDVSVLLDLMIHDLDLIAALAGADFTEVDAVGVKVLSDQVDIANARVRFANGCTANITSSRVSIKVERKLRIFQRDAYFSADLQKQELTVARKNGAEITHEHRHIPGDALQAEIESFLGAVRGRHPPLISGEDGRRALRLSLEVGRRMTGLDERAAHR